MLAGLGVGSGGLYLLWLKEGLHLQRDSAFFFNLCFFAVTLFVASAIHARQRLIDFKFLFQIMLFGLPGVFLGKWIGSLFPDLLLRVFLGVFLIVSGIFSLIVTKKKKETAKEGANALDKQAKKYYNSKEK